MNEKDKEISFLICIDRCSKYPIVEIFKKGQWCKCSYIPTRFILHPKLSNPIPRTEASLKVKLAQNFPNKKRAKRQFAGLYEVLKPGSYVTKSSPATTIINEPGQAPVKVRDSDLAKFGPKAEQATKLWTYAQRRPVPYEQTTAIKIAKHSSDLKEQKRGEIKIRHCQRDTTSVVSSVNSMSPVH